MKPVLAVAIAAIAVTPALAQGGYSNNGANATPQAGTGTPQTTQQDTTRHERARSSIDKSGTTNENGGSLSGAHGKDQGLGAVAPGNTGGAATSPTGR